MVAEKQSDQSKGAVEQVKHEDIPGPVLRLKLKMQEGEEVIDRAGSWEGENGSESTVSCSLMFNHHTEPVCFGRSWYLVSPFHRYGNQD